MADEALPSVEEATQIMMKKLFRRSSLTPSVELGHIKSSAMATILNSMGQSFDEAELNRWIASLDPNKTGTLDFEAYTLICGHFLKDPAAIVRGAQDEFAFRHLIGLPDFSNP